MIDRLIIPMSGLGKRFLSEGYETPKYLLNFNRKSIISWQLSLLKDIKKIDLVCNSSDLNNESLKLVDELQMINKNVNIIGIAPHDKGPGWALYNSIKEHSSSEKILVSYCDFYSFFDLNKFEQFLDKVNPSGAIFTYTQFHPHRLRNNKYAYVKKIDDNVVEVKEKSWFTNEPFNEEVSNGMYYYSDSLYLKQIILDMFEEGNELINNELYLSVIYNKLIQDKKTVKTYQVDNFFQFGTPQDYEDLLYWHKNFYTESNEINNKNSNQKNDTQFNVVLLASGYGTRLKEAGYDSEKAVVTVGNKPMAYYSYCSLIESSQKVNFYVIKRKEQDLSTLWHIIKNQFKHHFQVEISSSTQGQADSLKMALEKIDNENPILVLPCDSYFNFDNENLMNSFTFDSVIWTVENYPYSMLDRSSFAWIKSDENRQIQDSRFKESPEDKDWSLISGAFSFKSKTIANKIIDDIFSKEIKVNNEYYLDTISHSKIRQNYNISEYKVDKFLSLGTLDELKTFQYLKSLSELDIWKS